ncbi:hypothetical protein Dimus_029107, partial [Dionaea muscipula]
MKPGWASWSLLVFTSLALLPPLEHHKIDHPSTDSPSVVASSIIASQSKSSLFPLSSSYASTCGASPLSSLLTFSPLPIHHIPFSL